MQRVNMGVIQTFARKEIKFLLTEQQYQDFLPLLNHYMNPDKFCVGGKEYGIYNIYYDTPDDFLIRESLEKPDYKEKIRLRSYLSPAQPEDTVFLEIKKKICGIVNKRRVTMTLAQAEAYLQDHIRPDLGGVYLQEQVMDEIEEFRSRYAIEPKQYISYQRAAYFGAKLRRSVNSASDAANGSEDLRIHAYVAGGGTCKTASVQNQFFQIRKSIRNVCAEPNEMGPSAVHH